MTYFWMKQNAIISIYLFKLICWCNIWVQHLIKKNDGVSHAPRRFSSPKTSSTSWAAVTFLCSATKWDGFGSNETQQKITTKKYKIQQLQQHQQQKKRTKKSARLAAETLLIQRFLSRRGQQLGLDDFRTFGVILFGCVSCMIKGLISINSMI